MSLNKQNLNNQIVVMRHTVKWAKFQTIRKLALRINLLKKRFNFDNKKEKYETKIKKLDEEISTIKDLKEDEISAFSLINTKNSIEVLSNPNSSSKLRALTRLSGHKSVLPIVEMFRAKYPDWKETAPKVLIALKTGAKIKPPKPAPLEVKDTYTEKDERFVLGEEHHFEVPENTEDTDDRINENSDLEENLSLDEVDSSNEAVNNSSLLIKKSPSLKALDTKNDNIEPIKSRGKVDGWLKDENEEKNMFEKSDESMAEESDESNDDIDGQSVDSAAENCNIIKGLKTTVEGKGRGQNAEEINKADNKLMELKKLIKSNTEISETLVKSILFDESSVSFDKPKKLRKVKKKHVPRSDLSIKDSVDNFKKSNSIETQNFNNVPNLDESKQRTTVDPFFMTQDDKEYLTCAPIVEAPKEIDSYNDSTQFSESSKSHNSFLRLNSKEGGDSRPFDLKKRGDYNNSRQPFDLRRKGAHNNSRQPFDRNKRESYNSPRDSFNWQKKDGSKSRFPQRTGFEPLNRSSGRDNFRKDKPQFKSDRTRMNNKRSLTKDNSETSLEKLHPSWQAKKQQSTIAPFSGKKITFE